MKKIFTLACAATALLASIPQPVSASARKTVDNMAKAEAIGTKHTLESAYAPITASSQARADEEDEWVKVSTGIWFEGPLAARFSDVDAGQWDVDIYQNEAKPGWIRLNPYTEDTPPAQLLGKANENYLDICISDPAKVYFLDWTAFGSFLYGSYCPENEWPASATGYGNLTDGIITFPAGSVAYLSGTKYSLLQGEMKIVLDKSTYIDYTVAVEAPFCATTAEQYVKITKADGVATVKIMALKGHYPMNDNNATILASSGIDFTSYVGSRVNIGLEGPNVEYSILYVGLDADGNIKAQGAAYTYIVDEDADNWKSIGQGVYTEGVISELFNDIDSKELACEIQENVNTPGYYRLVNPYANFGFDPQHAHNHYLYINATDPAHVYVEPSVLGVYINSNFGEGAAMSWGNQYLDDVATGEQEGVWGKLENGVITVPAMRLQLSAYQDGGWLNLFDFTVDPADAAGPFKVVLPAYVPSTLAVVSVVGGHPVIFPLEKEDDGVFSGEIEVEAPMFYFAEMESDALQAPALYAVDGGKHYWGADEADKEIGAGGELALVKSDEPNAFKLATEKEFPVKVKYAVDFSKGTVAVQSINTGVESINADNEGAVEYFNLQGIRIENPTKGQTVIRRQGSNAGVIMK